MTKDPWRASSLKTAPGERSPNRPAKPRQGLFPSIPSFKTSKHKLVLAGVATASVLLVTNVSTPRGSSVEASSRTAIQRAQDPEPVVAMAGPTASPPPRDEKRLSYFMSVDEIDGLPVDLPPWTPVELWVSWDPPITDEPLVQMLNDDVVVQAILPPAMPNGSYMAKLGIRPKHRADVIYADRYGNLSVMIVEKNLSR